MVAAPGAGARVIVEPTRGYWVAGICGVLCGVAVWCWVDWVTR
jgi:Mg2+ and Co2+ transporter CorA